MSRQTHKHEFVELLKKRLDILINSNSINALSLVGEHKQKMIKTKNWLLSYMFRELPGLPKESLAKY